MVFLKKLLKIVVVTSLFIVSSSVLAQMPGQRINPNVMLLLDTGRGMNWTKILPLPAHQNPPAELRTLDSIMACEAMNEVDPSIKRTSWQILVESLLGGFKPEYIHCFYEDPDIRPLINKDTIKGLVADSSIPYTIDEYQRMYDLTIEYRKHNKEPHFRMVHCWDPREVGNRGDWNEYYQQCIGKDPPMPGREIITKTGRRYWCRDQDYELLSNGEELCFNYHPLELERLPDGILKRYETLAKFGVATFDNIPSPTESDFPGITGWNPLNLTDPAHLNAIHRSGWDYRPQTWPDTMDRTWYITSFERGIPSLGTQTWNAGIKGDYPQAVGRLVRFSDNLEGSNQAVAEVIRTVEPLHCSFDAAMIDDIGEYFFHSPEGRPAYNVGADLYFNCRPRYAIFITDGVATDGQVFPFPEEYCNEGQPPLPPWDNTTVTTPYSCPYNWAGKEAQELFNTAHRLAGGGGVAPSEVEPVYLVVIGVNIKGKDFPSGRCDGAPTWNDEQKKCEPPETDCFPLQWVDKPDGSNCLQNNYSLTGIDGVRFATPRQYLNIVALYGWPETGFSPYSETPGTFKQPPWRQTDGSGSLIWDWCDLDDDNCGGEHGDGFANGAIFVDSPQELTAVLDNILNGVVLDEIGTRTEIASTDVVRSGTGGDDYSDITLVQQYVFNSGYHAKGGQPWSGFLYRQGYRCIQEEENDSGTPIGDSVDFAETLKSEQGPDSRLLYALPKDITISWTDSNYLRNGADVLEVLTSGSFNDCTFGAPAVSCGSSSAYKDLVLDHLYGKIGPRQDNPLGDIYNSTPAILGPPREMIPIASYNEFKEMTHSNESGAATTNFNRQPYLYVGTNDGILHSFNTWAENNRIEGWGFVPSELLSNIDSQFPVSWEETFDTLGNIVGYNVPAWVNQTGAFQHMYGVDASAITADVLTWRRGGDIEKDYWRSLVVGGLGRGGYGYYSLDVTNSPETKPRYRWELSPSIYGINSSNAQKVEQLKEMGLGLSKPAFTYIYFNGATPESSGVASDHEEAFVILPGGYLNTENAGIETSTGVYMVKAINGELVRYLKPDIEEDLCDASDKMFNSNLFTGFASDAKANFARTAQLIGEPIVPNGIRTGKVNDEAFIGDDRGRIWRINMTNRDPEKWCLEVFFDTLLAEHFPFQDCLDSTGSTPGTGQCCNSKNGNVTASCQSGEIDSFMTDGNFGIDSCQGIACTSPDYPFPRIPMLAPPVIIEDEERNNVFIIGSGQIDGLTTLDHHRVFSIKVEPTIKVEDSASHYLKSDPIVNWWIGEPVSGFPVGQHMDSSGGIGMIEAQMFPSTGDPTHQTGAASTNFNYFGLGEKLMGRPAVFDKVAYFVTFTPLDKDGSILDACDAGGSKIWGVNFNNPTDFEKLPEETGSGLMVPYYERPGQVLTGLRIVRRPGCAGGEGFTLMVQKAQPDVPSGTAPGSVDSTTPVTSESIKIEGPARGFTRVGIDSWSIVLGGR